jgi:hypothetical protein
VAEPGDEAATDAAGVVLGPWPAPCPIPAGARVALWADGSLGARVAAAWLAAGGLEVVPLVPGETFAPAGPMDAPGGWGVAHAAAAAAGAAWLVLPALRGEAPDAPLRWWRVEEALAASGMGLWVPLERMDLREAARLGLALGVDLATALDVDARLLRSLGVAPGTG